MPAKPQKPWDDRRPVDGIPPFFVSQKSVVKVRTTATGIATAIFGCLLSKWHLVTRLLGLGHHVDVQFFEHGGFGKRSRKRACTLTFIKM